MLNQIKDHIVSSKEVLEKTGISRATLNNYIRMGIIPRPVVRKPINGNTTIKNLGYFPFSVIERIETVRDLKKQGNSMEEIIKLLAHLPVEKVDEETTLSYGQNQVDANKDKKDGETFKGELQLTLEEISYPAYLLNYNFEIEWINSRAENRILNRHSYGFLRVNA